MIKANVTGVSVRFEENPFTENFDLEESIIVNGKVFTTRRAATHHHRDTFGVEATFNMLVDEARHHMVKLLRENL